MNQPRPAWTGSSAGTIPPAGSGRTPIGGVGAAGKVSDLSAMVSVASGEGTMAAAAINAELAAEPLA